MKEGKRPAIGLVINQIEGRYQAPIHRGLSDFAADNGMDLFIFVGRSLSSPYENEDQHNTIYSLAKSGRLDGLVVTAGSIGNYLPPGAIDAFLAGFAPLPVITIGMSVPGIPGIITDNRSGISAIVKHFIEIHRAKRIAFLGGPATSPDAKERLESFLDAVRENGLAVRDDLVFLGDFSFRGSQDLAASINTENGLPFDAIVSANDDMALGFMSTLKKRGFRAPSDYAVSGFDDVPDAEHFNPALTTVAQPLYEQGVLAGRQILSLIAGETVPERTVKPANLVIRESCGCFDIQPVRSRYTGNQGAQYPDSGGNEGERERILYGLCAGLSLSATQKRTAREASGALFDSLRLDIRSLRERPLFIPTLRDWLDITGDWENASGIWQLLLFRLQDEVLSRTEELRHRLYVEDLFRNAYALLARITGRESSRELADLRNFLANFRDLSRQLEQTSSLAGILDAIQQSAPRFSLENIAVCLHENGIEPLGNQAGAAIYRLMKYRNPPGGDIFYDADEILPIQALGEKKPSFSDGCVPGNELVIMPLQGQDISFGYITFSGRKTDPVIFDTFRDYVSRALESLDRLDRAKKNENALDLATDRLKESEERFRGMAENLPMMVIETDASLAIRYANLAATRCLALDGTSATLSKFIYREDLPLASSLSVKLTPGKFSEFPGIRFVEPLNHRIIPVLRVSGIFSGEDQRLSRLRWNALDPHPIVSGMLLPDTAFFAERKLSEREEEIARLLLQGLRIRDIADRLFIVESTVKGHLVHIYNKFGVSNRSSFMKQVHDEQSGRYGYNAYIFSILGGILNLDDPHS
jgi:DNA-binding LacI/PurR family transcriptional regulator/DNA-binding CsgD family transcriptional regulator